MACNGYLTYIIRHSKKSFYIQGEPLHDYVSWINKLQQTAPPPLVMITVRTMCKIINDVKCVIIVYDLCNRKCTESVSELALCENPPQSCSGRSWKAPLWTLAACKGLLAGFCLWTLHFQTLFLWLLVSEHMLRPHRRGFMFLVPENWWREKGKRNRL